MAKKKYYQNKKDRKDESRGMREYYAGPEMRYKMEYEGSMMIKEDHSAIANLPQGMKITAYPKPGAYEKSYINDGLSGIDKQMREDSKHAKREMYPEKY